MRRGSRGRLRPGPSTTLPGTARCGRQSPGAATSYRSRGAWRGSAAQEECGAAGGMSRGKDLMLCQGRSALAPGQAAILPLPCSDSALLGFLSCGRSQRPLPKAAAASNSSGGGGGGSSSSSVWERPAAACLAAGASSKLLDQQVAAALGMVGRAPALVALRCGRRNCRVLRMAKVQVGRKSGRCRAPPRCLVTHRQRAAPHRPQLPCRRGRTGPGHFLAHSASCSVPGAWRAALDTAGGSLAQSIRGLRVLKVGLSCCACLALLVSLAPGGLPRGASSGLHPLSSALRPSAV